MFERAAITSLVLTLGAGCMDANSVQQAPLEQSDVRPAVYVGSPAQAGERPHGLYQVVPQELLAASSESSDPGVIYHATPHLLYINFDGGTYTPGNNNSSTNTSSIINSTRQIQPWGSSSQRAAVLACIKDQFAPFNITVTDQDPGSTQHIEGVVAGYPQDIGMQSGVGGVSPFTCGVIDRSIAYTFAEVYGNATREICETAAQEIAHSFGLDHEYLCQDPMTYLTNCGNKSFQDQDVSCGEYSARSCQCGGSTQNSYQMLLSILGPPNQGDNIPPDIAITEPANGATVAQGFVVKANASDNVGVTKVQLWVDGSNVSSKSNPPWNFTTDSSLAAGNHSIELRAFDGSSNMSNAQVSVTIDTGNDPNNPNDPNDPNNPPTGGDLGTACTGGTDCNSGLCLSDGTGGHCTQVCDPNLADSCPSGFSCVSTSGSEHVCWPDTPNDPNGGNGNGDNGNVGGGCQSGGGSPFSLVFIAGLFVVLRRRRRIVPE